jgi:L-iditol 2-dehydrogenase
MNNGYSTALLKSVYHAIPEGTKPFAKQLYGFADLRTRAIASRRTVCQGHRVEFLDFEIAYLEPFEFLGPGPDEAMVKTHCTLVSPGTERAVLCGLPGVPRGIFPFPPGYSAVGTVQRVGRHLGQFREGQRVAGRLPHASAGIMSSVSLFAVPAEVSDDEACFIELGIITLQGVRRGCIAPGHRVAVVGQGLIGQLANRLARASGAARVVGVAASRTRAGGAVESGSVDEFLALADHPALGDIGADVVIEAVGSPGAVLTAMSCARDGGTVVLLGSSRGLGRNIDIFGAAQRRRITMAGAHISVLPTTDVSPSRFTYEEEGRLFIELLRTKRLAVADLITWRANPADCNAVYEVLARGGDHHVGIMFDWKNWTVESR